MTLEWDCWPLRPLERQARAVEAPGPGQLRVVPRIAGEWTSLVVEGVASSGPTAAYLGSSGLLRRVRDGLGEQRAEAGA